MIDDSIPVTYTVTWNAQSGAYDVTSQIQQFSSAEDARAGLNGTV
mgnify:CR=1 FL=1